VKRSGRDEPRWVSIHMCMEATARNLSVQLSLSLTSKNGMSFLLSPMFSLPRSGVRRVGGKVAQIMHIHLRKCKNDKRKKKICK
jgi:hypothetical protein